jgi:hypothetical protein
MDTNTIRSLVAAKAGCLPVYYEAADLRGLDACLGHGDIRDYLSQCLSPTGFVASGVRVHNLNSIRDEVCPGAGPGGYIFPHGYVVVASSIGGNAVCFHSPSGRVVWADHEGFAEDTICYKDRATGQWQETEITPANIERAVVSVSLDIAMFLRDLLADRLDQQLEALDFG